MVNINASTSVVTQEEKEDKQKVLEDLDLANLSDL